MRLTRRDLLRSALAAGVVAATPSWLPGAGTSTAPAWARRLILVELDGGNDGLNAFVPWADPAYRTKRPTINLADTDLRTFADSSGVRMNFNLVDGPGTGRFKRLWDNGELAVALGVGMPNQSHSHFRGMDVWNSGSSATTLWTTGWLQRALTSAGTLPATQAAQGVILSRTTSDPLAGSGMNVLAMNDLLGFVRDVQDMQAPATVGSAALQHILRVQGTVVAARAQFETKLGWNPAGKGSLTTLPTFTGDTGNELFPAGDFGKQCRTVAQVISAGIEIPVFKIRIGGFDNHSNQLAKHNDLLAQFAHGLTGLRDALNEKGRLADTLIMTYSEFGRRVEENGSKGTDHGSLAPHVLISGAGNFTSTTRIHGVQPSLSDLDSRGDLKWIAGTSLDYRSLYATALRFLGMPEGVFDATYAPLPGLLTI